MNIDEDNYCRLARAIIERHGGGYEDAMVRLAGLRLHIKCGPDLAESPALQAALLTAVNTGKRAFLGGVTVEIPEHLPMALRCSDGRDLATAVIGIGGCLGNPHNPEGTQTICIGNASHSVGDALSVWVAGWRGGVSPANDPFSAHGRHDLPLAGVMAGSLAVARGFLQGAGLTSRFVEAPIGYSLWRPDLDAREEESDGPALQYLPKRLWFIGLGHLGQGYIWSLGLLPYRDPTETLFVLQDFDRLVAGNRCAGLLYEDDSIGLQKTRLCSRWLENRGFQTRMIERPFDGTLHLQPEEPMVALCGLDSIHSRLLFDEAPFRLIVDCGLGDSLQTFDRITLHTFPDAEFRASQIWGEVAEEPQLNEQVHAAFGQGIPCGVIAENIAKKALATSFVGAFAGSFALAEILRGLHGGKRCEVFKTQLRNNSNLRTVISNEDYQTRAVFAGACEVVGQEGGYRI